MARRRPVATAPRRIPQRRRGRQTVARILAATRRLLTEEGPLALNTNRIAREVGVGIGSLYGYFPNKEAIVAQLMEVLAAEEAALVLARLGEVRDRPLPEVIRVVVRATCELYRENHALYRALWAVSGAGRAVGHRPGEQQIQRVVREMLAGHARELSVADLDRAAFTCFHLVESLALQMAAAGDARWDEDSCVEEIVAVVLRYLGLSDGSASGPGLPPPGAGAT